ncbi:hypothetical protein IPG41_01810 [Candidatus Peregrinibacteria bacterium]|nr:MAG: hypothetical protein IPG41_01810 [Candidatus Peregrinibacteria bacterium]
MSRGVPTKVQDRADGSSLSDQVLALRRLNPRDFKNFLHTVGLVPQSDVPVPSDAANFEALVRTQFGDAFELLQSFNPDYLSPTPTLDACLTALRKFTAGQIQEVLKMTAPVFVIEPQAPIEEFVAFVNARNDMRGRPLTLSERLKYRLRGITACAQFGYKLGFVEVGAVSPLSGDVSLQTGFRHLERQLPDGVTSVHPRAYILAQLLRQSQGRPFDTQGYTVLTYKSDDVENGSSSDSLLGGAWVAGRGFDFFLRALGVPGVGAHLMREVMTTMMPRSERVV